MNSICAIAIERRLQYLESINEYIYIYRVIQQKEENEKNIYLALLVIFSLNMCFKDMIIVSN